MKTLRILPLLLVIFIALALIACSQSETPSTTAGTSLPASSTIQTSAAVSTTPAATIMTPQYGGTYLFGGSVTFSTVLRESVSGMGIETFYDRTAHDTLLRLDEKGNLAPYLATDWKIDAPNKTITLTLRKGVKFHDGTDFNAQAVKWSFETRKAGLAQTAVAPNSAFESVKSIEAVDDYTVRINLNYFDNTFLPVLWFIPSEISSPTDYQKLGKDKAKFTLCGTGPFKLVEYNTDVGLKFERNNDYWQKGKPFLDGYVYKVIADPTTHELLFRKGEIDTPPLDADVQQRLKDTGEFKFVPSSGIQPTFWELIPDSANADSPWANKKVREAAEYAIDKEAIATKLGGPTAVPQYQWGPIGTYAYIPDLPARKYDPAKAKALLTEAGYPDGFKTTAFVGATIQYVRDMELSVHEYWRKVGIDIAYNQLTLATLQEKSRTGWRNGVMDSSPRIVPDWLAAVWGNYSTAAATQTKASMLRSTDLDALMMKAKSTSDLAERDRLAKEVNKYISENALSIQIYSGGGIGGSLYQKNIQNVGGNINVWGASQYWGNADVWKSK
jgi:peptide/nickel transport system substrate-binding protein